ncbi:DNA translocase FtsK 4TM domain-containing protein [Phascolarctobacterium sp.]|uniref:FtsK/SpoIIIE family DNA translocase n=1 Tax=Phascolarctobacterium sp. TaxID=2049039 RepID=UPI003866DCD9
MQKDRTRRKQQNKDTGSATWCGWLLLAVGVLLTVALVVGAESGVWGSLAKMQYYVLGKGVFLLPVCCFVVSLKLLVDGRVAFLHKKTLGFLLVMLCLLGTAHHVFVPFKEELYPNRLLEGGGLLGGCIALALHRLAGESGTTVVLAGGWLLAAGLLAPWGKLKEYLQGTAAAEEEAEQSQKTVAAEPKERKAKPVFKQTAARRENGGNTIKDVYRNSEFGAFTDGIEKKSSFQRILNFNNSDPYKQEPVKQEVERDPVQVPIWQEEKRPAVVLRPVINYDAEDVPVAMPERSFLDGSTPAPEPERPLASNVHHDDGSAAIHNRFREQLQHRQHVEPAVVPKQEEERKIAIFDSAEKLRTEQKESTPVPAPVQPAVEQEQADQAQGQYILPPLDLLDKPKVSDPASYQKDIMEQCAVLEQTLADFRVRAKVVAVTRGPSVTRFELEPAPGVKVSSVVNLADDIALRLAAPGVRIEAPIPGKSAIGIEAPNIKNDMVCFREVVEDSKVSGDPAPLCIGLGKDISGNIIPADLAKMPHLLVAGSTGSGKSVCINTIIAGLLYRARPEEVKLILVDPKVVELSNYNGIPHLLTPVVTEPKKAASALHWAVAEMERRYKLFAESHVREIKSYNSQAAEKLPFIVIIIDELSDLMMVAKVDVEDAILRLAQKARAAGIHLILATQRPSVDVITGIVKANIPSRIAFAVSSQTDSRTIIDMGGAEKLLGKGDMLYYPIGFNKPVRVQGAFVTDAELNKIVDSIVGQSIPVNYTEEVTQQELECDSKGAAVEETGTASPAEDELFEDALSLVLDMGQASASMLQRRFRIGYTRAARLVDTMEELGIVGQSVGSKPREVIMARQEAEERFLNK